MRIPRKFVWLADEDSTTSHLVLKTNNIYSSGDISTSILIALLQAGKLKFIEDAPGDTIPDDVVLEVQKGTIPMKDLLDHLDAGLKKEIDNG